MNRSLKIFSMLTTLGMFLVLLAGALVTNTDSADGCGRTWPLCNGELRPMATLSSLIEYNHRLITGVVGLMVIILFVWMRRTFRLRRDAKWLSFFFVFLQSALGASAVMWPQSDAVLALHFGFSSLALSSVFLLAVVSFQQNQSPPRSDVSRKYCIFTWGLLLYFYGLIYLGAYVRRIGAGLAIDTWPLNNGKIIPDELFQRNWCKLYSPFGGSDRVGAYYCVIYNNEAYISPKKRFAAGKYDMFDSNLSPNFKRRLRRLVRIKREFAHASQHVCFRLFWRTQLYWL